MTALYLAENRGRFLYEIRPDLMPFDQLSDLEVALWDRFYRDRNKHRKQR